MNFLEEIKHFSIHQDEYNKLPKKLKKFVDEYENITFYPRPIKVDKVKEVKKIIKAYIAEIKKNKNQESNVEALIFDKMLELLTVMKLEDIRKLKLEKLL